MTRMWRWGAVLLYASFALCLGSMAAGLNAPPPAAPWQISVFNTLYGIAGIVMAVWAWRHRALDQRSRRAWGIIAVSYLILLLSGIVRGVLPAGAFPTPGDTLRLLFAPVLLAGLLTLPLRTRGKRARHKMWLDTTLVMIGCGMLLWYFEAGDNVDKAGHISGNALAAAIAYPAFDLVMIFGATVLLLRGAAASVRRPAVLITLAMLALVVGDAYFGYVQTRLDQVAPSDNWQYACWITGPFLLAMAAYEQVREAANHDLRIEDPTARTAARLPYFAMGLGYALLVFAVRNEPMRTVGLVLGAVAMTSVVVARQVVALRENHELATTDTLTGLVNRRQLYSRLRIALARARGRGTVAAVLIDMNGFKQVNDTMGHEAGDQLLVAFGQVLRANVFGTDVVSRLGGDEFAIVLHDIASVDNAIAVVNRIIGAMQEPVEIGEVAVQPQASFGIALALSGEDDADALLHRADLAMYQAKENRTTGYAVYAAAEVPAA
ncbi:GGDEF domain-containing protein [Actinoplanes sp. NPDC026619]|uniref:GGDEF domain-containing protein n=1 Tax=Actinoplanes sp. NPDC026619 TaxID=3155798 RepID=UPI0033C29D7A